MTLFLCTGCPLTIDIGCAKVSKRCQSPRGDLHGECEVITRFEGFPEGRQFESNHLLSRHSVLPLMTLSERKATN